VVVDQLRRLGGNREAGHYAFWSPNWHDRSLLGHRNHIRFIAWGRRRWYGDVGWYLSAHASPPLPIGCVAPPHRNIRRFIAKPPTPAAARCIGPRIRSCALRGRKNNTGDLLIQPTPGMIPELETGQLELTEDSDVTPSPPAAFRSTPGACHCRTARGPIENREGATSISLICLQAVLVPRPFAGPALTLSCWMLTAVLVMFTALISAPHVRIVGVEESPAVKDAILKKTHGRPGQHLDSLRPKPEHVMTTAGRRSLRRRGDRPGASAAPWR